MFIQLRSTSGLSLGVRKGALIGLSSIALTATAIAQSPAPSSSPILSQAIQAFSAGKPVTSVMMTGTATWTAGSTKSSGPAKLTANVTGENVAEFDLSNGARIEKQSALAENRTCTWSGKDGVEHDVSPTNCWFATVWFLPHLAIQSTGLPTSLNLQSVGVIAEKTISSPHIQYQTVLVPQRTTKVNSVLLTQIQTWSKTDLALGLSMLPSSLKYNLHPDGNVIVSLPVEVRYSNYKPVSGVQLPMHIERYVNGNLQVSIDIDSATVN
ncbi:MAG: hypothetical protein JSS95_15940 [Acidobacteria bacterium]|nr:hypothetical protein [Acidobacteriota bacterium]